MTPAGVMRPILLSKGNGSVNQRFPSGPAVIRSGLPVTGPNSVILPRRSNGLIRPILLPLNSVNQMLPSGPTVMPCGLAPGVGIVKKVNSPAGVSFTIAFLSPSVNQMLPSGPLVMPSGTMLQASSGLSHSGANPVNWPSVVTLPMKKSGKPEGAVNHSAPSGPATISSG
jgi:hypothetical protein